MSPSRNRRRVYLALYSDHIPIFVQCILAVNGVRKKHRVDVLLSCGRTCLGEPAFITGSMLSRRISKKAIGAVDELGMMALSVVTECAKHLLSGFSCLWTTLQVQGIEGRYSVCNFQLQPEPKRAMLVMYRICISTCLGRCKWENRGRLSRREAANGAVIPYYYSGQQVFG